MHSLLEILVIFLGSELELLYGGGDNKSSVPLSIGGKGYRKRPKGRKKQSLALRRWIPVGLSPKRAKRPRKATFLGVQSLVMT